MSPKGPLSPLNDGYFGNINIFRQGTIHSIIFKFTNYISERINYFLKTDEYINSKYPTIDDKGNNYRIEHNYSNSSFVVYRYGKKEKIETYSGSLTYLTHKVDNKPIYEITNIESNDLGNGIIDLLLNQFFKFIKNFPSFLISNDNSTKKIVIENWFTEITDNVFVYGDVNTKIIDKIKYDSVLKH